MQNADSAASRALQEELANPCSIHTSFEATSFAFSAATHDPEYCRLASAIICLREVGTTAPPSEVIMLQRAIRSLGVRMNEILEAMIAARKTRLRDGGSSAGFLAAAVNWELRALAAEAELKALRSLAPAQPGT